MDISHNHHHHISPLAITAVALVAGVLAAHESGYLPRVFHKEILASINPADVLTAADMVRDQPTSSLPVPYKTITASVH
ncbi:MAG: hypothetical protein KGI75_15570 [Rhizobiaceae bacterium]|nr:hypothetical protein [Rhizobiaceae bacterium]